MVAGVGLNLRPLGYEHYDSRPSCSAAAPEIAGARQMPCRCREGPALISPVRARLTASCAQIRARARSAGIELLALSRRSGSRGLVFCLAVDAVPDAWGGGDDRRVAEFAPQTADGEGDGGGEWVGVLVPHVLREILGRQERRA